MAQLEAFRKRKPTDRIWWTGEVGRVGAMYFSFDKKTVYNVYQDYPNKLTPEQKELFDKENPEWAELRGNMK